MRSTSDMNGVLDQAKPDKRLNRVSILAVFSQLFDEKNADIHPPVSQWPLMAR